jgi:hypothetical protein
LKNGISAAAVGFVGRASTFSFIGMCKHGVALFYEDSCYFVEQVQRQLLRKRASLFGTKQGMPVKLDDTETESAAEETKSTGDDDEAERLRLKAKRKKKKKKKKMKAKRKMAALQEQKKPCTFDPKVNIMKYKPPETADFKDKIAWEDKVAETFTEVKNYKLGGPPLHKFIHGKVRKLEEMRHRLFRNSCGSEPGKQALDDDDDDDDDTIALKKKKNTSK